MKRIAIILIGFILSISSIGQNIDQFIGEYVVSDIWSQVSGERILYSDTSFYSIRIEKKSDSLLSIINFAQLSDTIFATVFEDSIYISPQTVYLGVDDNISIKGNGKFINDTIYYQYKAGGARGRFIANCIAVKEKSSSEKVTQNSKFIKCYPNPSFDQLHFEIEIPTNIVEAVVRIYAINGAIVKMVNITKRGTVRQDIDLSDLVKGSYLIELKMDNQNKKHSRIVKAK